ncbi:MAG: hypothetical protein AAGB06_00220 [Verrucomicrobiota bacterium]
MTTKTYQAEAITTSRRPRSALTFLLSCLTLAIAGCGLQKPDDLETESLIRMKEGYPLPESLHGTWSLDYAASKSFIEERASSPGQLKRWLTALEEAKGSSMKIDAERWKSQTPRGNQSFQAALLSEPNDSHIEIGIEAYKSLVVMRIIELTPEKIILASETNPMMKMFIWIR